MHLPDSARDPAKCDVDRPQPISVNLHNLSASCPAILIK